eukprot:TRINITY_DN27540_c0_g1_i1.p1 TRINITY_DN27540_c0_g1~~TRINITY_DN27540_c0_g1_i1.p1  ORF type:complete len:132 (+),score=31.27 TRINITY_DN27540_c0_g1_i1:39-398(+)
MAWVPQFKRKMDELPFYRSYKEDKDAAFGVQCDACNRKHARASYKVMLEGIPYDSRAFLEGYLEKEATAKNLEPIQEVFNVGSHCHKRTELYHRLHHYKYHLLQKVKETRENSQSLMLN